MLAVRLRTGGSVEAREGRGALEAARSALSLMGRVRSGQALAPVRAWLEVVRLPERDDPPEVHERVRRALRNGG